MAVTIKSIQVSAPSTGVLKAGSVVTFTLRLSQPSVVSGQPVLLLNDGGVGVYDPVLSQPGSATGPQIIFHYTVGTSDATSDLTIVDLSLAAGSIYSNGSLYLNAPTTLNVGSQPTSVAVADLNNDNKPDIVVTNAGDGTVSVLQNQANFVLGNAGLNRISFGSANAFAAGSDTTAVAVGDFNSDSIPDLVVTDASGSGVVVLKGDGKGNSTPLSTSTTTGPTPVAIAAADFNNDGKTDIVVANSGNKTISVLFGTGSGTFYKPEVYTVGSDPTAVVTADVNGDGKADIIVVNGHSNSISVLLNDGTGAFEAAKIYKVGSGPWAWSWPTSTGTAFLTSRSRTATTIQFPC